MFLREVWTGCTCLCERVLTRGRYTTQGKLMNYYSNVALSFQRTPAMMDVDKAVADAGCSKHCTLVILRHFFKLD